MHDVVEALLQTVDLAAPDEKTGWHMWLVWLLLAVAASIGALLLVFRVH